MISYRTLLFGTIAVIAAAAPAAPAVADSVSAQPLAIVARSPFDSVSAQPLDSVSAQPLFLARTGVMSHVTVSQVVAFENFIVRIGL